MATVEIRNITRYIPKNVPGDGDRKLMWQRSGPAQPIEAAVYKIKAGHAWPADHYHPHCAEFLLVWDGNPNAVVGTLLIQLPDRAGTWQQWTANPKWQPEVYSIEFQRGDSLVVPRGAIHRITAAASKDLMLLVVHPDDPLETVQAIVSAPTPPAQPVTYKRNLDTSPNNDAVLSRRRRAKRNRVWGMDPNAIALPGGVGLPNPDGVPDASKPQFNAIHYVFKPGQWNAAHFHPHSVELVICRQGNADATVVLPETAGSFEDGWKVKTTEALNLAFGDTMIVPKAALHEYWDAHGTDDLLLLAMQTPQPIMHITRDMIAEDLQA